MENILNTLSQLWEGSGFCLLLNDWRQLAMIIIACVLLYLGLVKKFEPQIGRAHV